jgi:YfiH family protein
VLITDDSDLAVAVQTADCVPILIASPTPSVVAAVHAGWRGIVAGAAAAAVEALSERGATPGRLLVAIGPAIGPCCYEVGSDVREAVKITRQLNRVSAKQSSAELARWFLEHPATLRQNPSRSAQARPGHWCFDMWTAVRDQLIGAGVRGDRIFNAALCTASHPEWFWSYRRNGIRAGRMAAVIRSVPSRL